MKHLILPAALLVLGGCATIADGSMQPVTISSNAPGATCGIIQNGEEIAPATPVPNTFELRRRDGNLLVTCQAPGYSTETVALVTGKNPLAVTGHMWNSMTLALVDVFSGAVNEYTNTAYVPLQKL